jgi:hypothetical protein
MFPVGAKVHALWRLTAVMDEDIYLVVPRGAIDDHNLPFVNLLVALDGYLVAIAQKGLNQAPLSYGDIIWQMLADEELSSLHYVMVKALLSIGLTSQMSYERNKRATRFWIAPQYYFLTNTNR